MDLWLQQLKRSMGTNALDYKEQRGMVIRFGYYLWPNFAL